jgi:tRNA(Ile)-lysidine synthase
LSTPSPDLASLPLGSRVGVALSGGVDSTALLFLLAEHSDQYVLSVIHVNHGLRGPESDADEDFCRQMALRLDLRIHVMRAEAPPPGVNMEEFARDARQQFFSQLLETNQVDFVVTAHTRDDQAETVLFRILRGAHLSGLTGIHPSKGRIVRPLLERASRADLETYLRERGIPWREDSSNLSLDFSRNRIRHELLPQLERDWNPEIRRSLARMGRLAYDEEQFWKSYADQAGEEIFARKGNTAVVVASKLMSHPVAVARRLVRWIIQRIKGDIRQIEYLHVEAVLDLARLAGGHGRVILPGVDVMRSFEWLRFAPYEPDSKVDRLAARNQEVQLTVPGEATAADGSLIRLELVDPGENDTVKASDDLWWEPVVPTGDLTLRCWKPGDQYEPAGNVGEGPKKLKTMFQDGRVPLWDRATWPIITVGTKIIWARKFGPAKQWAAGDRTAAQRLRITRIV